MLVQDFGLAENFGKLPTMVLWLLTASLLTCSSNCFPMVGTSVHFTAYYFYFQQWASNLAITHHNSDIFKEILKHPFLTEGQTLPAWWQIPQIQQHRIICPHKFPTMVTHITMLYFTLYNTLSHFSPLGNGADFTGSFAVRKCLATYAQPRVGNGIPACHPGNSYCTSQPEECSDQARRQWANVTAVLTNQTGAAGGTLIWIAFAPEKGCCGYQRAWGSHKEVVVHPLYEGATACPVSCCCGAEDEAWMCKFSVWSSCSLR